MVFNLVWRKHVSQVKGIIQRKERHSVTSELLKDSQPNKNAHKLIYYKVHPDITKVIVYIYSGAKTSIRIRDYKKWMLAAE